MIRYSPINANSAEERIDFHKDNQKITLINRFDVYAVYVDEEDDDFDPDEYDPDQGIMMTFTDEEEGERISSEVHGDLSDQERQQIIDAFAERLEGGVSELGWQWTDRELWFYGPLQVESE